MNKLSSYKLLSHPSVLLKEHLERTASIAGEIVDRNLPGLQVPFDIQKLLQIICLLHDGGKATSFFQEYIKEAGREGKAEVESDLKQHGLLSAIITYWAVKESEDFREYPFLPFFSFLVTKHHHGNLDNVFEELSLSQTRLEAQWTILEKQLKALDYQELMEIYKPYGIQVPQLNEAKEVFNEIYYEERAFDLLDEIEASENLNFYLLFKLIYSILIFSDKQEVIFHEYYGISFDLPFDLVDQYKRIAFADSPKSRINQMREEYYQLAIGHCKTLDLQNRILDLTMPTGSGKTLTVLSYALHLREQKIKKGRIYPKIIYALPFTSIIDQNHQVITEILETVLGTGKATSERLLKHHHLAEVAYKADERELEPVQSKYLIDTWNAQIITTTFVQLLTTLFSNRNAFLVKYHSLLNSIVILDEVQAIPHSYWAVIKEILAEISNIFNIHFILVTATQPLIFEPKKQEVVSIIQREKQKDYNDILSRTKVRLELEERSLEEFMDLTKYFYGKQSKKSGMIVLNTIKSAQSVMDSLKANYSGALYFLSAGLIPKHRLINLAKIKKEKNPYIIVSTQVVEAGMDLDLDWVIRDFGPWDSINQVTGRCNRHGKKDLGNVLIVNLVNEHGKQYSKMVYGSFLIEKTLAVLKGKTEIREEEYEDIAQEYYSVVKSGHSEAKSEQILQAIYKLDFEDCSHLFELIPFENRIPIFVEADEEASILWDKYEKTKDIKDTFERRIKYLEFKRDFLEYVITVSPKDWPYTYEGGFGKLPYEELERFYSTEKGYCPSEDAWIL